jgi:hypothetical protein
MNGDGRRPRALFIAAGAWLISVWKMNERERWIVWMEER